MQHPGCAPLRRGEDESANRGPPLGWEAPGRGVAPGCKALAEAAREGPLASPDPTPCPSAAGLRSLALPFGPPVGGSPSL